MEVGDPFAFAAEVMYGSLRFAAPVVVELPASLLLEAEVFRFLLLLLEDLAGGGAAAPLIGSLLGELRIEDAGDPPCCCCCGFNTNFLSRAAVGDVARGVVVVVVVLIVVPPRPAPGVGGIPNSPRSRSRSPLLTTEARGEFSLLLLLAVLRMEETEDERGARYADDDDVAAGCCCCCWCW